MCWNENDVVLSAPGEPKYTLADQRADNPFLADSWYFEEHPADNKRYEEFGCLCELCRSYE